MRRLAVSARTVLALFLSAGCAGGLPETAPPAAVPTTTQEPTAVATTPFPPPSTAPTTAPVFPTPAASRTPPAHQACAWSPFYQLAYEVDGMEDVEVTCDIAYRNLGEVEATLDLYLPPDTPVGDRLPAVVLVHGNDALSDPLRPVNENWKSDMYTHGLVVAASGMAAVAPAYRGYRASDAESVAAAQQDLLDLLAYLDTHAAELMIDPERLCIWTTSGGGISGAWAALFGDPQPSCAVIFSGDLGTPSAERSPDEFVSAEMPPFFIASGALDAYGRGSQTFIERAATAGADLTIREHPGGGNGHFELTADDESRAIIGEALEFMRSNLAGSR